MVGFHGGKNILGFLLLDIYIAAPVLIEIKLNNDLFHKQLRDLALID